MLQVGSWTTLALPSQQLRRPKHSVRVMPNRLPFNNRPLGVRAAASAVLILGVLQRAAGTQRVGAFLGTKVSV